MTAKFKKIASAVISAVIAFSVSGALPVINAETTETPTYTLSYNFEGEGVTTKYPEELESVTGLEAKDSVTIAHALVNREGYYCSGWTADGVFAYLGGDNFIMPDHDVVLEPVWMEEDSDIEYTLKYYVEIDGEVEEDPPAARSYQPGAVILVNNLSYSRSGYEQMGWTDGENVYPGLARMIMPDHDVTLEPHWLKYYHVTYTAGDVDGMIGNSACYFLKLESCGYQLPESSRLSRMGYKLTGWESDYDGQIYPTLANCIMPSCDVVYTAVWTPINYTVVFKVNNGSSSTIKIAGETGTSITVPECSYTKPGYKFAGWSYESEIYQPGEEFVIRGAMPGLGIMLTGVWVEEGAEEEEPCDIFSVISARQAYVDGEITGDELRKTADFVMGRSS